MIVFKRKKLVHAWFMRIWKIKINLNCFASWNFSRSSNLLVVNWLLWKMLVGHPKDRGRPNKTRGRVIAQRKRMTPNLDSSNYHGAFIIFNLKMVHISI